MTYDDVAEVKLLLVSIEMLLRQILAALQRDTADERQGMPLPLAQHEP